MYAVKDVKVVLSNLTAKRSWELIIHLLQCVSRENIHGN